MEKKILIPVDFEQQSILNLEWAKYYANFNNAQIILTHIIEETGFLKKIFKQENFEEKIIEEVKGQLKEVASKYFSDDENYTLTVEKGKPYEEIEDLADEFNPEMIILGRNENSSKSKKYLGSNTLHIITETDYPVVTIYGTHKPENSNKVIFMPVDLTKSIDEQTTVTLEFAKLFGAKVHIFTVDNINTVAHDANIKVKMNKLKEFFEQNGVDVTTEVLDFEGGSPAEIINEKTDEIKPMLVVIMLRDESNFKNFVIGSVAIEIIQNCNAPVLSVKPWDKDNEKNPVFDLVVNPLGIF